MPGELLERESVALEFSLSALRGKDFPELANLVHVKTELIENLSLLRQWVL